MKLNNHSQKFESLCGNELLSGESNEKRSLILDNVMKRVNELFELNLITQEKLTEFEKLCKQDK